MTLIDPQEQTNIIIYSTKQAQAKAVILYLHGGGFIFGSNDDLPSYHIQMLNDAGYTIIAINYPLAPETKFPNVVEYIIQTINLYTKDFNIPYFLWGRSAGAYLCLLACSKGLDVNPNGIISYYGYGLLVQNWYSLPSEYYLKYPLVESQLVKKMLSRETIFSASVNPRFLIYLQARQNGAWLQTISGLTIDAFIKEYSLINTDFTKFPPVLLAHNTKDNDVPYAESLNLHHRIFGSKLISFNTDEHDFDKKTEHIDTQKLLNETIKFLNENMLKKAYK